MDDIPEKLSYPVDRQPADKVVLIEPPATAGDDTSIATAWVRELQRRLTETSTSLSIPVVFSVEGGKIRGRAVGYAGPPPSAVRVLSVKAVADPVETPAAAAGVGRPNRPHIEIEIDRSARDAPANRLHRWRASLPRSCVGRGEAGGRADEPQGTAAAREVD